VSGPAGTRDVRATPTTRLVSLPDAAYHRVRAMVDATPCPACGHVSAPGAEACASCGKPLARREPTAVEPSRQAESEAAALRALAERMAQRRTRAALETATPLAAGARPAHYAGFVIRAVAFAIDLVVLGVFTTPLTLAGIAGVRAGLLASGTGVGFLETEEALPRLFALAWLAMAAIYFTALHAGTGQTIGKAVVGIAVRRARDLAGIGVFRSLVRVVAYAASAAAFFLGFLTVILNPRKRAWHDYLAGTCVVHLAPEEV
jgi:uncharacterized RDD family membrane protein YckC